MTKETSDNILSRADKTKDTKPRRKTKLERTAEAQLFLEQGELQKQLEAEELNAEGALSCAEVPECKPVEVATSAEVHEPRIVRRLRKL